MKFFPGQPVRIAACTNPDMVHYIGEEDRVLRYNLATSMIHNIDCYELEKAGYTSRGEPCCWAEHHLEPIIPNGHQAGTLSYKELMESLNDEVSSPCPAPPEHAGA